MGFFDEDKSMVKKAEEASQMEGFNAAQAFEG